MRWDARKAGKRPTKTRRLKVQPKRTRRKSAPPPKTIAYAPSEEIDQSPFLCPGDTVEIDPAKQDVYQGDWCVAKVARRYPGEPPTPDSNVVPIINRFDVVFGRFFWADGMALLYVGEMNGRHVFDLPAKIERITKILDAGGRERGANHGWTPVTGERCRYEAAKRFLAIVESRIIRPPGPEAFRKVVADLCKSLLRIRRWQKKNYALYMSTAPSIAPLDWRIPTGRSMKASVGVPSRRHRASFSARNPTPNDLIPLWKADEPVRRRRRRVK
jgi:hypothetical protein